MLMHIEKHTKLFRLTTDSVAIFLYNCHHSITYRLL